MGRHLIPSLAGGLVDEVTKGEIDQHYSKRATELENVWIKPNDSVAKRPGLQRLPSNISDLTGVLDVKYTKDRIHVLRKPELGSLGVYWDNNLTTSVVLDTINADSSIDSAVKDSELFNLLRDYKLTKLEGDKPATRSSTEDFSLTLPDVNGTGGGNPVNLKVDFSYTETTDLELDELRLIDTFDRGTNERIDEECFAILSSKDNVREKLSSITIVATPVSYTDLTLPTICSV